MRYESELMTTLVVMADILIREHVQLQTRNGLCEIITEKLINLYVKSQALSSFY